MTASRERILAALRGTAVPGAETPAEVRVVGPGGDRVALLTERLADYGAAVYRTDRDGLAGAVARALAGARVVAMPREFAEQVRLGGVTLLLDDAVSPIARTALEGADATVTGCTCAVALSGSLVLQHGPREGRRILTLLPDHHVCVVEEDTVVDDLPAALRVLDAARPMTFISGPSATSDIEMTRIQGVHGPRRLSVVMVGGGLPVLLVN